MALGSVIYRHSVDCSHCGTVDRPWLISRNVVNETDNEATGDVERGTFYDVLQCTVCHKLLVAKSNWGSWMESEDDEVSPDIIMPDKLHKKTQDFFNSHIFDVECMTAAFDEAKKCDEPSNDTKVNPKVGVVVAKDGKILGKSRRGEVEPGEHAEYSLLTHHCSGIELAGSTVYTTLEPCVCRNFPKIPCAELLVSRKVRRVVIGMLDPDQRITGKGILKLRHANIEVDLFTMELMSRLEELNSKFILDRQRQADSLS